MSKTDEVIDFMVEHPALVTLATIGVGVGAWYLFKTPSVRVSPTLIAGKMALRYKRGVESVHILAHAAPLTHEDVAASIMEIKNLCTIKDVILITEIH